MQRDRLTAIASACALGGLLSLNLVACAPAAAKISCTVAATGAATSTSELLTVKTTPGATVRVVATYASASITHTSVSNAQGVAPWQYSTAGVVAGHTVTVSALVQKTGQQAKCSTSFTRTTTSPKPPSKPPLSASINVAWWGVTLGAELPYTAGTDASCFSVHVKTGGGCGTVVVSALVKGFGEYGGLAACPTGSSPPCAPDPYGADAALSGSVTLTWQLKCTTTGKLTTDSATSDLGPSWMSINEFVSSSTRIDKDSAKLQIAADLPLGHDVGTCSGPSDLQSVKASAIALHLGKGTAEYPASDFKAAGPYAPS